MQEKIQKIQVDQIIIEDDLHRTKKGISPLVESLQTTGQINPVVLKKKGSKYIVVAGRRRVTALKTLQAMTGKKQQAMAVVRELDLNQEDLIKIDENIMREQLDDWELDEALARRKEIYEELHPETKQHAAGGTVRAGKAAVSFSKDAAEKLQKSKKTIQRAVARSERASAKVKVARQKGLTPSKVDLLVTLKPEEQDLLLPIVRNRDFAETKSIVDRARKLGAKAVLLYLKDEEGDGEDSAKLKAILRDSKRLEAALTDALKDRDTFNTKGKLQSIRILEDLEAKIAKFVDYQRAAMGSRSAIRKRGGERTMIRAKAV